jgi:hypothetical protein
VQDPPKFTQFGTSGLKTGNLATLENQRTYVCTADAKNDAVVNAANLQISADAELFFFTHLFVE